MHKLALLAVLVAAPAFAQKAKYTRSSDVKVDVKLTERSKPKTDGKGEAKGETKPAMTADLALSIEGLKGKFQEEQEQILKKLIDDTPDADADEKANYMFMLGELFAKQHRYWRLKAIELEMAGKKKEAEAAAKTAREKMVGAVSTYKDMTGNDAFRNYPKMDTALFYYGYTLQSGRYLNQARAAYDKLLKNYPKSKYVPEAHFAFGEHYFEQGQLADAEARYRKVLEFPKTPVYWHAQYKVGWIHLNLGRPQEALETFFQVALATRRDAKLEVLNRAARKDFVRAYAEVGKAERAFNAFRNVDDKRALEMLATLADLYLEQGKSERAIFTYQELMRLAPTNAQVCLWQYNIVHATLAMPRGTQAEATTKSIVKEIENLVRVHGAVAGKLPKAEAQECHENAAAMSGEYARAYHAEYAKTKNAETLAHAEKLYRAYLGGFANAPNRPRVANDFTQTQYYYAELLWARAEVEKNPRLQTELWERAATAFADVVETRKLDAKLTKEAAYAAVLGWKNALDVDPRMAKHSIDADDIDKQYENVPQPKAIPEREQKMLAAFRFYIDHVKEPDDDEVVRMKFLEANTYRRYNQFAKAVPLFEEILAKHATHETAELAANLLLDIHNKTKAHEQMLALVDKLAADAKFLAGKEELAEVLGRLRIQARRKTAEDMEKRGRAANDYKLLADCGHAYLDIYNANPEAKDNDQVLYNAIVCFHDGKSVSAALTAYDVLSRYYRNSKLMPRAVGRIGMAYGDIAFYEKAAEKLEEYARKYAGEKDAYSALNDAVVYRKGIGHDDKAIEDTKYFVRMFGDKQPDIAASAHFSIAAIYEKQGNADALVRHLREYVAKFGAKGGADRLVIAHAKIGQALWQQSCPVKLVDGSCVEVTRKRAISVKLARTAQQQQCGSDSKLKLRVVERDRRKVEEAAAAFARAAKEFESRDGRTAGDEAGAKHYYGQARLALADRHFEAYLAEAFPHGLDFDPRNPAIAAQSKKRFETWFAGKRAIGAKATAAYEAILPIKDAATSIAAAARIGQIQQHFSDVLFTAEIPKNVRTGAYAEDKIAAFCDELTEVAEPLEARSLEAFRICLDKSTDLGWFSDWSRLCERELGQIRPEEFPTAAELRGTPKVANIITVEGPIVRLE